MSSHQYRVTVAKNDADTAPVIMAQDILGKISALSSHYAPTKEATRILAKEKSPRLHQTPTARPSLICLFGLGSTALLEQTLHEYTNIPVIALTRDPQLVTLVLQKVSPRTTLAIKKRLHSSSAPFYILTHQGRYLLESSHPHHKNESLEDLSAPQDKILQKELEKIFKDHSTKQIRFVKNPSECKVFQDFFVGAQKSIITQQEEKAINRATFSRFEKIWFKNLIRNTKEIINAVPIASIFDSLAEQTIAIIGAAPSLEDELVTLEKHQEEIVIIAVDTVMSVLLKHKIIPDIVVSIDPQKINAKYLEIVPDEQTQQTVLVAEPSISHYSLRKFANCFMFDNFTSYYGYLTEFFGAKGSIHVGGSVATVAFELARQSNPRAVALLGIDLAYSRERYHLRGAFHEESWFGTINRFDNFETRIFSIIDRQDVAPVMSRSGETLYTDAAMELYKRWFEKYALDTHFPTVHTSNRGQILKDIPHMPFPTFIEQHCATKSHPFNKKRFRTKLQAICQQHRVTSGSQSTHFHKRHEKFMRATQELIERIAAYAEFAKQAETMILRIKENSTSAPSQKTLAALAVANTSLQKPSVEKQFIGSLIQETLYRINDTIFEAQDSQQTKAPQVAVVEKERLAKALLLYREIIKACELNIGQLKSIL